MFVLPVVSRLSARGEFAKLKALVEKSIAFSTIGLIPVLLGFLLFAPALIAIVYQGRYTEAIPLLRVFSLLSLVVPAIAVSTNTLMGLGHARTGFTISVQILVVSIVLYVALTPLLGPMGTTAGYVASSFVLAWLTIAKMNVSVPIRLSDVLRRTNDVTVFLKSRLGGG
jgi:O-antigen/teichoic acid export membrane protein